MLAHKSDEGKEMIQLTISETSPILFRSLVTLAKRLFYQTLSQNYMVRFTLVVNKERLVGLEKQQQFDKKTKTGEVGKT